MTHERKRVVLRRVLRGFGAACLISAVLLTAFAAVARRRAADPPPEDPALARASQSWLAPAGKAAAAPARDADDDVLTAQYGNGRLGWNAHERVLTTANVNSHSFGPLFRLHVDGQAYAQPLVVSHVAVPGHGVRNLLIVATEGDTVYAFDSDNGALLWRHSFVSCCGVTAVPAARTYGGCEQIEPTVGISSTPVIDRRTKTVYVVANTMSQSGDRTLFHNALYALDVATGADRVPPRDIVGSVNLSWRGAFAKRSSLRHSIKRLLFGGTVQFDSQQQFNRPGLLLSNGNVYVAFASHCDVPQAHGWIFAYTAHDLKPVGSFATIGEWHDDNGGGIWQSGFGLTADSAGHVYFTTGNGPFDADSGGRDFGDSLLELSPDLHHVVDYFTPYTQAELDANDADLGGGGMIALPDGPGRYPHLAIMSSKVRAIFLLDRDHLGRYTPNGPDHALQIIGDEHDRVHWCIGTCGGPAYFAGPTGEYVFNVWAMDALRAYRLERSGRQPKLVEVAHSPNMFPGFGGTTPTVSSNGNVRGTAIVWATTRPPEADTSQPVELYAYDASDVSHVLYHGTVGLWRNRHGAAFLTPTVANGKVYVGGGDRITVFGLLDHQPAVRS